MILIEVSGWVNINLVNIYVSVIFLPSHALLAAFLVVAPIIVCYLYGVAVVFASFHFTVARLLSALFPAVHVVRQFVFRWRFDIL